MLPTYEKFLSCGRFPARYTFLIHSALRLVLLTAGTHLNDGFPSFPLCVVSGSRSRLYSRPQAEHVAGIVAKIVQSLRSRSCILLLSV